MKELKPCPFCGGERISIHEELEETYGRPQFFAQCVRCCATVWGDYETTRAKAYASAERAWNRRDGERHAD